MNSHVRHSLIHALVPAARISALILVTAFWVAISYAQQAGAQRGTGGSAETGNAPTPEIKCALHGGTVAQTKDHYFEVVFSPDGARVYMYTAEQGPMMIRRAAVGSATLNYIKKKKEIPMLIDAPKDGEKTVYFCPMHAEVVQMEPGICTKCGTMKLYSQNYFFAKADLSKVSPDAISARFEVSGLKGPEAEAKFSVPNSPGRPPAKRE
jgi:hypothetical protein